ncbi:tRNA pseudouridine(38-40) synthase TruA [Candidatus Latescibacterota bacterium]
MTQPSVSLDPHPPDGRTIRLDLEYDGTDFVGWQIQARGRSIQGELHRALGQLLREEVMPVGSGRTDAGTHALGQVAHFHTTSGLPPERLARALNSLLPPDIAVTACSEASGDFHARYSALSKRYRYRIATAKPALDRRFVWTLYRSLDLQRLNDAAGALSGTHQFAAFCKQDPVPERFDCRILDCCWYRQGLELVFEVEANRFLRHMVRILVGTMVEVGLGQRPGSCLPELLAPCEGASEARERRASAGPTAPATGLCLLRVVYPEE